MIFIQILMVLASSDDSDEEVVVAVPKDLFWVPQKAGPNIDSPAKPLKGENEAILQPGLRRSKCIEEKRTQATGPI